MSVESMTQEEQDFDDAFAEKAPADNKAAPSPEPVEARAESQPQQEDESTKLQRELAEAIHRERSSANRLSHFMRESSQLKAQIAEMQRSMEAAKAAPAPEPISDERDVLNDAPDLETAVERRVQKAVGELRQKLDAADRRLTEVGNTANRAAQTVEPLVSQEEKRQVEQVYSALDQSFDGWREAIRAPEFAQWLNVQPEAVQGLYQHGRTVQEAGSVLKLFYADKGVQATPRTSGQNNSDRLRRAAGIAPRAVSQPSANSDDFEGAFAKFSAMKQRR